MLAPEVDRSNDIGYVGAACDHGRVPVDHAVVDLAGSLIARIARLNEFSA